MENFLLDLENEENLILEKTINFLKNYLHGDKILIGLSGGPDSMLTFILIYNFYIQKKFNTQNIYAVYCNHGIRKESEKEEKILKEMFNDININFLIKKRETNTDKKSEEQLRYWRFYQFKQIMEEYGIDILVLGHNFTDKLETTFLNMMRGFDPQFINSMKIWGQHYLIDNKFIFRPLLDITKEKIKTFMDEHNFPYFVDKTNEDENVSMRNFIRKKLKEIGDKSNSDFEFGNKFLFSRYKLFEYLSKNEIYFTTEFDSNFWPAKQEFENKYLVSLELNKIGNFAELAVPKLIFDVNFFVDLKTLGSFAKNLVISIKVNDQNEKIYKLENFELDSFLQLLRDMGNYKYLSSSGREEIWSICENKNGGRKRFGNNYLIYSGGCRLITNSKLFGVNIEDLVDKNKKIDLSLLEHLGVGNISNFNKEILKKNYFPIFIRKILGF